MTWFANRDPQVFADSNSFKPTRWHKGYVLIPFTPRPLIWLNDKHGKRTFFRGLSTKYCKCSDGSFYNSLRFHLNYLTMLGVELYGF